MRSRRLAHAAWAVLAFNLLVILWGAWVRVSGSGAGCGSHWPLCDGEVIPRRPSAEKAIEFTHRATSGVAFLAVAALLGAALRTLPRGHRARRAAAWAMGFMTVEAGVGAALVLLELVADDASLGRAAALAVHLVNTFLLLAALALTARHAAPPPPRRAPSPPAVRALAGLALALLLAAGASGAVAALGDTLYPARSLAEAVAQDLSPTSHLLLRLRLGHPALAAAAAVAVLLFAWRRHGEPAGEPSPAVVVAALLALAQAILGLVNVALLAPVALQLAHLLLADLLWIATVLAADGTRAA